MYETPNDPSNLVPDHNIITTMWCAYVVTTSIMISIENSTNLTQESQSNYYMQNSDKN